MHGSLFVALAAPVCFGLMAGAANARMVTGVTKSTIKNLQAVVIATDGSQYSTAVTVTGHKTVNGKTVYAGKYSVDVPVGKNVMVQFATTKSDGSLHYVTTADFSISASKSSTRTWHFVMANAPGGGSGAVSLGTLKIGQKLAIPTSDPLTQVDEDGNGVDDYDDNSQCDEDDQGDQDTDSDGNGCPDDEDDNDQGNGGGNGQ
jgi:hypothetical protein